MANIKPRGQNYDAYSGGAVAIDSVHTMVHRGLFFTHCDVFTAVSNNANVDNLLIANANCYSHFRLSRIHSSDAPTRLYLYENPTIGGGVGNGNITTNSYNNNRNSSVVPNLNIYHSPNVTSTGTLLSAIVIPGSGTIGGDAQGVNEEWILNPLNTYLMRIENKAGVVANMITITASWYEPQP